ncbi:MAG: glutathione S-transferase family protein [Rhizobiales bacterium]|nr:glutathione S-transferase family protein [Hyphomicrobiales bacterium]
MPEQMILRHSKASPFCRKVDIAAKHHGLIDLIKDIGADVSSETDSLRKQNPLGKIPVLILASGENIYDSDVIVEHFELVGSGDALIPKADGRIATLTANSLAKGIVEAAVAVVYEGRLRPAEMWYKGFVDYQLAKVERGLDALSNNLPPLDRLDIANIMTAIALDYLNLRINEDMRNNTETGSNLGLWQTSHPLLIIWLAEFNKLCPYFAETCPYRD